MSYMIKSACGCLVGDQRDNNEDNFYFAGKYLDKSNKGLTAPITDETFIDNNSSVIAVFDGMGGEALGELASYTASKILSRLTNELDDKIINGKKFLFDYCVLANKAVYDCSLDEKVNCMGTTAAILFFSPNEVYSCNVGDSKIFRLKDSQLHQISEDHTDLKLIESLGLHKKPQLLQYIGIPENEMKIEPFISKGAISSGEKYAICSDGITDVVDSVAMYNILNKNDPEESVAKILNAVKAFDGMDNATIIVSEII